MKDLGIYIHIPFCERKCNYCDFYSVCSDNETKRRYVDYLSAHMRSESSEFTNYKVNSIFIGGGTPSILSTNNFKRITSTLFDSYNFSDKCEFTIEANPGTTSKEKLESYLENGVNRISFGLQSCNDDELKKLGRIHTYKDFLGSYNDARDVGFTNINIDVMYALPDQTLDVFKSTLKRIITLNPEHISAYCLKIEKGTPFYNIRKSLAIPDEEKQYEMYMFLCEYLDSNGYKQYEISNFAKKGFECKHNLKYWNSEEYLGFGPSSHSFVGGYRYCYSNSINQYQKELQNNRLPTKISEETHIISADEKMNEYVMLKMRLSTGVDIVEFEKRFGCSFEKIFRGIDKYLKSGHIIKDKNKYSFSSKGFFVSNYILSDILI